MTELFETAKAIVKAQDDRRRQDWNAGYFQGKRGLGLRDDASLAEQLGWREGRKELETHA